MMKNLFKILFLSLLVSFCFSDTIKFKKERLFRSDQIRVVENVDIVGISEDGIRYNISSSVLGTSFNIVECENVIEILDNNNNNIEFSCYPISIDIELEEDITPQNIKFNRNPLTMLGGVCITLSGVTQMYNYHYLENTDDDLDDMLEKTEKIDKFSIFMLTIGGFFIFLGESQS